MPSNSNIVKFIDSKTVVTADGDVEYLLLFEYCNGILCVFLLWSCPSVIPTNSVFCVRLLVSIVKGGSLLNIVERGVSMSFHEILTCFANICSAVAHLHLHDPPITHRDLKV
jgi:serine/threonine protein kinase